VWEIRFQKGGLTHLPGLPERMVMDTVKYSSAVADLRTELSNKFTDFKSNEKSMNLLFTPFTVSIDDVPGNM
jgi:hypothetical protein